MANREARLLLNFKVSDHDLLPLGVQFLAALLGSAQFPSREAGGMSRATGLVLF